MTARPRAMDDFEVIRARKAEIAEAEQPHCPSNTMRKLYDCLRSSARCSETCEFFNDWIGPDDNPPS